MSLANAQRRLSGPPEPPSDVSNGWEDTLWPDTLGQRPAAPPVTEEGCVLA